MRPRKPHGKLVVERISQREFADDELASTSAVQPAPLLPSQHHTAHSLLLGGHHLAGGEQPVDLGEADILRFSLSSEPRHCGGAAAVPPRRHRSAAVAPWYHLQYHQ